MPLPARVPRTAVEDLTRTAIPPDFDAGEPVNLVIRLRRENLRLRDFGTYLWFIDRCYGRLHEAGLASYAHRPSQYLEITRLKSGSIESVISEVGQFIDRNNLVLVWITLIGLPRAGLLLSRSVRNLAASVRDIEEARLATARRHHLKRAQQQLQNETRAVRNELREMLREETALEGLPDGRVAELARLLESLYQEERENLPGAARFSVKSVIEVVIRRGDREV